MADTSINVALCHMREGKYERAMKHCIDGIGTAEKIGNLRLLIGAYRLLSELYSLTERTIDEHIHLLEDTLSLALKIGEVLHLLSVRGHLARLLMVRGDLDAGAGHLHQIATVLESQDTWEGSGPWIANFYHRGCSILLEQQGDLPESVTQQMEAVRKNVDDIRCREDYLWDDLSRLESLLIRSDRRAEFASFCDALVPSKPAFGLEKWYLSQGTPGEVAWALDQVFDGSSIPDEWVWVDPTKGGELLNDRNGLTITPVLGAGFVSNVHVPRLVRPHCGDFVIETTIDFGDSRTRAGGILVYENDQTLLRFAAGIHYDAEITLTEKSRSAGFAIKARGILDSDVLTLRLERSGPSLSAWCSDGETWYACGSTDLHLAASVQVGLFAECSYRSFSIDRCTATPVRFKCVHFSG